MRRISALLILFLFVGITYADTWFVGFTDKNGTSGSLSNPKQFLSERAIERRQHQGIEIDSTDLPVSQPYLDSLVSKGATVIYTTKWLNGAVVSFSEKETAAGISGLPFVDTLQLTKRDVVMQSARAGKMPAWQNETAMLQLASDLATEYKNIIGLDSLHNLGFHGQGKMISVVDNGFYRVDELPVFSAARERIRFVSDIVNPSTGIYNSGSHGAMVFSLIGGVAEGTHIGTATAAEYCLFHTEDDDSESLLETDNMVCAFELADSAGTDIITSSLGYFYFDDSLSNFTYQDMNGQTSRCSRAATMAANKGILMCIAAGNEGNKQWHYINSPADAEGILTVGGVDINRGHSTFSAFGPTSDGRVKPEICALATAVPIFYPDEFKRYNGTSFATPVIAGAAASLWSALPELTSEQLRNRILEYSSQYLTPDSTYGYGIPDFIAAYYDHPTAVENTHNDASNGCLIYDLQGNLRATDITETSHLQQGIYIIKEQGKTRKIAK